MTFRVSISLHAWLDDAAEGEENRVPERVSAEMVANVFEVDVAVGDTIQVGQTALVLESMKMEIPVLAEVGGTVTKVAVEVGDVVQEGDLLVVIE